MPRPSDWRVAYVGLGSNLGDRADYLRRARVDLSAHPSIELEATSPELDNPPLLFEEQGRFLNQVARIRTGLGPRELLAFLKEVEGRLGRTKTFPNGPREIDLDILAFENTVLQTPELTLPHPGLLTRPFLRTLLADLGRTPEELAQGRRL